MSLNMPKFTEQFFLGLLIGAALAGLLTFSFAWSQLQGVSLIADNSLTLLYAAEKEIENIQSICGSKCDNISR